MLPPDKIEFVLNEQTKTISAKISATATVKINSDDDFVLNANIKNILARSLWLQFYSDLILVHEAYEILSVTVNGENEGLKLLGKASALLKIPKLTA